jgi:hypothetical protein
VGCRTTSWFKEKLLTAKIAKKGREVRQEMQQSFTEKSREDRKKADEIAKR